MKRKILVLPWILYSGLIYFISSLEKSHIPPLRIISMDKVIHIIEYCVYSFFARLALESITNIKFAFNKTYVAFMITVLFGASDEIHQIFVCGRYASVYDFLADVFGGIIGLFLFQNFKISSKLQNAYTKEIKSN